MKLHTVLVLFCSILIFHQIAAAQQNRVETAKVGGTWLFNHGTIKIWPTDGRKLQFEFFGTYQYGLADGTRQTKAKLVAWRLSKTESQSLTTEPRDTTAR